MCLDLDEEGGDEGPRQAVNAMLLKELIQREKPDYISDGIISDEAYITTFLTYVCMHLSPT